ncbi:MAG TPA: hypothetical protein VJJ47_00860 [Candidatus Paceibacterota bacterium]
MTFSELPPHRQAALRRVFGSDATSLIGFGPGGLVICRHPISGGVLAVETGGSFAGAEAHDALGWARGVLDGSLLAPYTGRSWPGSGTLMLRGHDSARQALLV